MFRPTEVAPPSLAPRLAAPQAPAPPAGDDGEPGHAEQPPHLDRRGVGLIVAGHPRGAEDRDRGPETRELLEPLDELAHDPQDPPRVRLPEGRPLGRPREQPLVLGPAPRRSPLVHSRYLPFHRPVHTKAGALNFAPPSDHLKLGAS